MHGLVFLFGIVVCMVLLACFSCAPLVRSCASFSLVTMLVPASSLCFIKCGTSTPHTSDLVMAVMLGLFPAFAWIVALPLIHNDYIGHASSKAPDLHPWDLCCPNICDFYSVTVLVIHAQNVVLVLVWHSLIKFSNRRVVTSFCRTQSPYMTPQPSN